MLSVSSSQNIRAQWSGGGGLGGGVRLGEVYCCGGAARGEGDHARMASAKRIIPAARRRKRNPDENTTNMRRAIKTLSNITNILISLYFSSINSDHLLIDDVLSITKFRRRTPISSELLPTNHLCSIISAHYCPKLSFNVAKTMSLVLCEVTHSLDPLLHFSIKAVKMSAPSFMSP